MRLVTAAMTIVVATACLGSDTPSTSSDPVADDGTVRLTYDFVDGSDGWAPQVSDYSEATRPDDVLAETGVAPPGFDADEGFFHLAATNRSDDLFQYMLRRVTSADGVVAGVTYDASFRIEFATNAPSGCAGVGGAPGESVWMKAGVTPVEPVPVGEDGEFRMTVDKGGQSQGGADAVVAGVIANAIPCEEALSQDPQPYAIVTLEATMDGPVTPDEDGDIWLFVGTDSGFEARTSIYYDRVEVTLAPVDPES